MDSEKPDAPSSTPLQFPEQPGPRKGPVALRSGSGNAEGLGGFLDRHADEIAQLDHLGLARFDLGEAIKDFVDGKNLVILHRRNGDAVFHELGPLQFAPMPHGLPMPRPVDQNAAHRFGGRAEKVLSPMPLGFSGRELQVGFMHQGGRLQGAASASRSKRCAAA